MGCGSSTLAHVEHPKSFKGATDSMLAGLTKGELQDIEQEHNAKIKAALALAEAEIALSKDRSVWDDYEADTELIGRGALARVFKARRRVDQEPVAIKVIGRDTKAFSQQRRAMSTKIATMRTLQGHPNMLTLHHVFEDGEGFHVVLEFCKGKALLESIHDRGHFSEREAAQVMRQLLEFLRFSHEDCNVVHRDIKPENLLLLDSDAPQAIKYGRGGEGDIGLLKVIDFGTAGFCEPGQHLHSKVGTARYVAPDVLNQDYDSLSDIWSAGVVMYILLCGHPPFKGSTETGTLRQVKSGHYKLNDEVWGELHESAKDMLAHMMVVDPAQRWTARELLQHPWLEEVLSAPDRPLMQQPGYQARLGAFTGAARVKRLALKLMVAAAASTGAVGSAQLLMLKNLFQEMDADGDGIISGQQLAAGLVQLGTTLTDQDLAEFLQVSRVDCHSEGINFNEFIAAMFDAQDLATQQVATLIEREFEELDVDHDGFITPADLVAASRLGALSTPTARKTHSTSTRTSTEGLMSPTGCSGNSEMQAMHEVDVAAVMHEVVHEALGGELTLAEAEKMVAEVDHARMGKISLQEFTDMVIGRGRISMDFSRNASIGTTPTDISLETGMPNSAAAGAVAAADSAQKLPGTNGGDRAVAPEDSAMRN